MTLERRARCRYMRMRANEQCTAEAVDAGAEMLLCARHIAAAWRTYEAAVTSAELPVSERQLSAPERLSIVYYIRRGDLIKIGTTCNPVSRLKALMPDEILAFEPGGPADEARRHRQFAWCRVSRKGEYFRRAPKLLAHIADTRMKHGAPPAEWPSVATLGSGYARTRKPVKAPAPVTGETMDVAQAARVLQVSRAAIYNWARRGLIQQAGKTATGSAVYYVEQMRFLADRNRAWMGYAAKRRRNAS